MTASHEAEGSIKMEEAKVVLVTGSSSGIGEATVKLFAAKGYRVAVCGSNKERVEQVAEACAKVSQHGAPLALVLDFKEPKNGELAVVKTVEHFGRLDVLINNAAEYAKTSINDHNSYDIYKQMMAVNTDAAVRATLAAGEHLKKSKGCLLFTTTIGVKNAVESSFGFCMSKTALSMMAKCFALDLAPHVRVNVVGPGPVNTPLWPRLGLEECFMSQVLGPTTLRGEVGKSEEVASLFYFLASDEASLICGQDIYIDGGYLIKMYDCPQRMGR